MINKYGLSADSISLYGFGQIHIQSIEKRKRCEHLTYLFLKAFGGARITKTSSVPTPNKAQALNLFLFVILFLQSPNFTESTNKLATLMII